MFGFDPVNTLFLTNKKLFRTKKKKKKTMRSHFGEVLMFMNKLVT